VNEEKQASCLRFRIDAFTFLILGVLTPLPIAAQTNPPAPYRHRAGPVRIAGSKVLIKITLKNTDAVREVLSDEEGSYTANL